MGNLEYNPRLARNVGNSKHMDHKLQQMNPRMQPTAQRVQLSFKLFVQKHRIALDSQRWQNCQLAAVVTPWLDGTPGVVFGASFVVQAIDHRLKINSSCMRSRRGLRVKTITWS